MDKEKTKEKFICSLVMPFGTLFLVLIGVLIMYLSFFADIATGRTVFLDISIFIMFGIIPFGLFIWSIGKFCKVIEISDYGVKSSLFKIFFKKQIAWEEIVEIRYKGYPFYGGWIFFSKTSLYNMTIGKARSQKGQIQIMATNKIVEAIKRHTDIEII
ncbi:MAG: hypothetical protein LBM99_02485 [Bacillales bacterium]|jgi:hypothetical protein|nr:hypothetical protein [Bacillales bacterium]